MLRLDVGRHVERDVHQEIAFHLDMRTRKLIASGLEPDVAAAKAMEQFGDLSAVRNECLTIGRRRTRAMRWASRVEAVQQDVRYAARVLRGQPAFAVAIVLMLAIGIGANTAVFGVVDALMLRTLPVQHPEQLVTIGDPAMISDSWNGSPITANVSYPVFADIRDRNRTLAGVYATAPTSEIDLALSTSDGAAGDVDHPRGRLVSGNMFAVLGVPAYLGRTFTAAEDQVPLRDAVAMISYGYWQRRFGGDRSAIGRRVTINGTTFTLVGVVPPWFEGDIVGQRIAVWIPLMMQPAIRSQRSLLADRSTSWLLMMGRLLPGVSLERARAEISAIEVTSIRGGLTGTDLKHFNEDLITDPVRVHSGARGFSRYRAAYGPSLGILSAVVALLVLIVSANVANLVLARSAARAREMTVRVALGAGRGRLIQQLLIESCIIAGVAGAIAMLFGAWGSRLLLRMARQGPESLPLDV